MQPTRMSPSWMPSIGDILFVLILYLLFACLPNFIFGDGSTGWHLVTGHYILDQHQIPRTDLISYTFPEKAWVAYEWLFDAFIAALDKLGGLRLVAVACCSAIAYLFLLLYQDCRKRGCHYLIALTLCTTGALVSAIHWLARPHLVTFFGVFIFTHFLREYSEGSISAKKLLIILASTMLIWVNCHPAFLMGIVIVGIYLVSDFFLWTTMAASTVKDQCLTRIKTYAAALLLVILTTLANPYGVELYRYIAEYLHQSVVLAENDEFSSPQFHGQLQPVLLELLYFALIIGLVLSRKRPSWGPLLTMLAYAHLSLAARRNMPLFVIVSLPIIAEFLGQIKYSSIAELAGSAIPRIPRSSKQSQSNEPSEPESKNTVSTPINEASSTPQTEPTIADITETTLHVAKSREVDDDSQLIAEPAPFLRPLLKLWNSTGATMDAMEFQCTRHALPVLVVAILAISCFQNGRALGVELVRSNFDQRTKASTTLKYLTEHNLKEDEGFNYDNWGGYIRYKTGKRVFIDDRSDFYGEKFYLDYRDAATAQPNWRDVLNRYKITWILFPQNSVLGPHLLKAPEWKLVLEDAGSQLFERSKSAAAKVKASDSANAPDSAEFKDLAK